ncbi:MAG: transcriptional repressor [Planctomycetota bacterium]|jgi:Fur family peroxide stress response transcriptional regulator|nr:transcriptional repressor [Planctomycetota bacterium]
MNASGHINEAFRIFCRRHGWRRTSQRRMVFSCLHGNLDHPRVDMVWDWVRERLPEMSLDSVYRILDEFAAAGAVRRLEIGKVMRYDFDLAPHGHYVCLECGRIRDFPLDLFPGVEEACRGLGEVTSVELLVRGKCRACRERGAARV